MTATVTSIVGTTANYSVSAPAADAIAVFDGTTKLTTIIGTSGTFSVAVGKTYTIYAVNGPTTSSGFGSTTVSPVAAVDSIAPVTASNAVASYTGTAAITLMPADNVGVTGTYYVLDGAPQVAGTSVQVTAPGTHTLEFWSVDAAGNVESRKAVTFTVTALVPEPVPDTTAPITTSDAQATYLLAADITLTAADEVGGSGVASTNYILDGAAAVTGTSVQVTAPGTHTLEFWSVDVAGNAEAHTTVSFTVTEPAPTPDPQPVPDVTAPVTVSDAKASYTGTATITLTAADETSGSGVAATYYSLDGAPEVLGTLVSTSLKGMHTLVFWSVDASGNVEATKSVGFAVMAPVMPPVVPNRCTLGVADSTVRRYQRASLRGTLSPANVGDRAALYVKKPGSSRWVRVATVTATRSNGAGGAKWSYSYRCGLLGTYRYQVRFHGMTSSTLKVYVR